MLSSSSLRQFLRTAAFISFTTPLLSLAASAQTTVTVGGTVKDANDNVIAGAKVFIAEYPCVCASCSEGCSCCPSSKSFTTDDGGGYEFSVPPGEYNVTAKFGRSSATARVRAQSGESKRVDLTLSRSEIVKAAGEVRGKVTLLDRGGPLSGAEVLLIPDDCVCNSCPLTCSCCPGVAKDKTDSSGTFSVSANPGTYTMTIIFENNAVTEASKVKVKLNKSQKVNVQLAVPAIMASRP